jgi:hypothetical protein
LHFKYEDVDRVKLSSKKRYHASRKTEVAI